MRSLRTFANGSGDRATVHGGRSPRAHNRTSFSGQWNFPHLRGTKEAKNAHQPMELLESVLSHVSLFQELRPDELGHVAGRFSVVRMLEGEERSFSSSTTE